MVADEVTAEGDFLRDTQLVADPTRPGFYLGEIPDAWKALKGFGGGSMAMALRGVEEAISRPDLSLLSANAIFSAPVDPGSVEVEARVLRDGRSAAQGMAFLRQAGSDEIAIAITATWGQSHESPIDFTDLYQGADQPE